MKSKWTKVKYEKLMKDARKDMEGDRFNIDDCARDIANSILFSEEGLREFMVKKMGVKDVVGRIASDL